MRTFRWIIALCAIVVSAWATVDSANNFAKVTVSTGYTSGATSIVLSAGNGALLPAVPFNLVWWNATDYTDPSDDPNKEIVRVTAVSTDTLTVTRAQEGTSAAAHNTAGKTYKMIGGPTALMVTQINSDIGARLNGSGGIATNFTTLAVSTNSGPIEVTTIPLTGTTISLSFTNGPDYSHSQSADTTINLNNTANITNRQINLHVTTDGTHVYNIPAGVYAQTQTNQPFAAGFYTLSFWIITGRTNFYVSPALIGDSDVKAAAGIQRSKIAAGSPNHVQINDGSGFESSEAQLAKSRGGTGADNSSVTFPSTGTITTDTGTSTFQNKTYDAAATGNTLKFKNYLIFSTPHLGDGIGAIPQTNDYTLPTFGHYKFSGSAATNANYVVYIVSVPTDIDTSVDLRARVKVRLSATETSASTFNIGVQDVADSNAGSFAGVTSAATWVQVPISSDASGAANDIETSAWITLTGWKSALTADHTMFIVLNRDGAGDTANTGISDAELKIEYGVTQ